MKRWVDVVVCSEGEKADFRPADSAEPGEVSVPGGGSDGAAPARRSRPRNARPVWLAVGIVLLAMPLLGAGKWVRPQRDDISYPSRPLGPDEDAVLQPPPPIDDEYFPCSDCHEGEPANPERRELDEHESIKLKHGDLWCLDCHESLQRDRLHLSDASPVAMEESWRLCTRCHAKKIPDWRAGVHGKRTGSWRGPKQYKTCVVCHDPHAPLFKPLEPKPPPVRAAPLEPTEGTEPEDVIHVED